MAPKRKATKAAPAKPKKGAKNQAPSSPVVKQPASADDECGSASASSSQVPRAQVPGMSPPTGGKRRAQRRDTDDAVERALQDRLAKRFSPALIEGAVNDKGQRIRDVVAEQIRMNRNQKKKLTSSFWAHLITSFKLSADAICDSLPDPQPDESISEE